MGDFNMTILTLSRYIQDSGELNASAQENSLFKNILTMIEDRGLEHQADVRIYCCFGGINYRVNFDDFKEVSYRIKEGKINFMGENRTLAGFHITLMVDYNPDN